MTYLTRLALNPARRGAGKLLGSPGAMHAAVLAGFPPSDAPGVAPAAAAGASGDAARVLWRVDRDAHRTLLYVVGPGRPDLTHLVEQAGWPTAATWETRDYAPVVERVAAGQVWAFRLRANPVKTSFEVRKSPPAGPGGDAGARGDGKVLPLHGPEAQTGWLARRGATHGFELLRENPARRLPGTAPDDGPDAPGPWSVLVSDARVHRFTRQGATVTLATAQFDGVLQVTDTAAFRRTLVTGIGRAKGYGCGLLTVARVG